MFCPVADCAGVCPKGRRREKQCNGLNFKETLGRGDDKKKHSKQEKLSTSAVTIRPCCHAAAVWGKKYIISPQDVVVSLRVHDNSWLLRASSTPSVHMKKVCNSYTTFCILASRLQTCSDFRRSVMHLNVFTGLRQVCGWRRTVGGGTSVDVTLGGEVLVC